MTDAKVDCLVKARDGLRMASDAIDDFVQTLAPPGVTNWNPDKIKWNHAQGDHGPYEKSEDGDNPDFQLMLKDLEAHKGKLTHEDYFYWVFTDGFQVGRKRKK